MVDATRRILLQGAVQGCGVRPELARLAARYRWSGSVRNAVTGVELILRGTLPSDDQLRTLIFQCVPSSARIDNYICSPHLDGVSDEFQILDSELAGPLATSVPLDRAICPECLHEISDPTNRRFGYPFTTCAQCGPRFSILHSMPFDRSRTTMSPFQMCAECLREYHDPRDRRFHAQTNSCPDCGPKLWTSSDIPQNQSALNFVASRLRAGQILALRGIGGYQLLADATSASAVQRLRDRKCRLAKPFAIMIRTIADAHTLARLNADEEAQLCSAANPIVLARQKDISLLAAEVNPGLDDIGLMLPTTALHALLLELVGRPLVCTSGNLDGEPLAYQVADAEDRLRGIADIFLHHDREIVSPIDDSVVRVMANRAVTIRAARGIAPLPLHNIPPPSPATRVLACGGHQKGSIAFFNAHQAVLGPHVGDLETLTAQDRWTFNVAQTCTLFASRQNALTSRATAIHLITPELRGAPLNIACDAHPTYFSSRWAQEQTRTPQRVWHHHAHIVAGMVEHGWLEREVLGVAWDGTGLGPDGTIWGGEFLRTTATQFQRLAHLRLFALPGGDAAIVDPRRAAISILSQLKELSPTDIASILEMPQSDVCRVQRTLNSKFSPQTTSVGRLFDVASLLILKNAQFDFEGYASMCLEASCDLSASGQYRFEIQSGAPLQLDWRPVIREIIEDRRTATPASMMAIRFHRALAQLIVDVADRFPELPVILQGGVFQNRVLVESVATLWTADRQPLGLPGVIPPNDGGLAVGQLAVSLASNAIQEN